MAQIEDEFGVIRDFTPEEEAAYAAANLEDTRRIKIEQVKSEGVFRINAVLPDINTLDEIKLIAVIWPMLDTTSPPANIVLARDIYQYAKTKITQAQTATQAELDAYDPATDPNWPA